MPLNGVDRGHEKIALAMPDLTPELSVVVPCALMDKHLPRWRSIRTELNASPLARETWRGASTACGSPVLCF